MTDANLLDAAAAGREVGTMTALVMMRCDGDPDAALDLVAELRRLPVAEPQGDELDALTITGQAIRDAIAMRDGGTT